MPGAVTLRDYQEAALRKIHNGCILHGTVGSGKSRTGLAWYYEQNGGRVNTQFYRKMTNPKDIYIITTAKKRDSKEWEGELSVFGLSNPNINSLYGYKNKVVVDSWNNIGRWKWIKDSYFIFDEQRVVGWGAWVKSFLEITKHNQWILLSATPGDTWNDYIPVFVANGYYKNKTDFENKHCVFNPFVKWKSVQRYVNEGYLIKLRNELLIEMEFKRNTNRNIIDIDVNYDKALYRNVEKLRINVFTDEVIENSSEYCQCLRRVVNTDVSRQNAVLDILQEHDKAIIFYFYDYELDILRTLLDSINYQYTEWNGHKHENVPTGPKWAYLVQYTAGSEAWNCITTDTMIFYSLCYSYKMLEQSRGRIDRMNTPFTELYYYQLISKAPVDIRIYNTLKRKKTFNEKREYAKLFERNKEKE